MWVALRDIRGGLLHFTPSNRYRVALVPGTVYVRAGVVCIGRCMVGTFVTRAFRSGYAVVEVGAGWNCTPWLALFRLGPAFALSVGQ
jgi:hypothetical protein